MRKSLLFMILVSLLWGCGPKEQRIADDFKGIFYKENGENIQPIILSVGPGEGDTHGVYEYIRFDVIAATDMNIHDGWFKGVSLKEGDRLSGYELVILYQRKYINSQWKMIWYELYDLKKSKQESILFHRMGTAK